MFFLPPNKSPEPTAVGAGHSVCRGSRRESAVVQLSTINQRGTSDTPDHFPGNGLWLIFSLTEIATLQNNTLLEPKPPV
jgi:hypothetical protein